MALTLDMRVEVLEGKVRNLETWAGPGQNQALSDNLSDFRLEVNGKLAALSKDVAGLTTRVERLQTDVNELKTDVAGLKTDVNELKTDVAGLKTDVNELKTDVAGLKTDVNELKTDVAGLKTDVNELKTDVAGLKTDVNELKTDVAGLRVDFVGFTNHARGQFAAIDTTLYSVRSDMATVQGTLAEILDRLPAKAA